jgi:hypothetical protein
VEKVEVSRRQLGTVLALFLENGDPVSVHTLACAGSEIAEHLTRKVGRTPFAEHILATFPDFDRKRLKTIRNQYCNAFKHATTRAGLERTDQELLDRFTDEDDHTLYVGWTDYGRATGALPIEAQAFMGWYYVLYSEKVKPDFDMSGLHRVFPSLISKSREEQKLALREVIATYRKDDEIMSDAATERLPLVLGAF